MASKSFSHLRNLIESAGRGWADVYAILISWAARPNRFPTVPAHMFSLPLQLLAAGRVGKNGLGN
jgi:hypothetical protein